MFVQIKQLITSLWSVSVTTWRSFAKSFVFGQARSDTYIPNTMDPIEISENHIWYMKSLKFKEDSLSDKFPSFHWTPKPIAKLHKSQYKHRFIASSLHHLTAQQKQPSYVLLTRILSAIKGKSSNLSSFIHSRTGINEMWILKNSPELLQKNMISFYQYLTSTIQR